MSGAPRFHGGGGQPGPANHIHVAGSEFQIRRDAGSAIHALPRSHVCRPRFFPGRGSAYAGLGVLLALAAFSLLLIALKNFASALWAHNLSLQMVNLLDQILLVLLIIELLYTVKVSFREHGLLAEPFLVVALIAVVRRILVLTAEVPKLPQAGESQFRHAMIELSLLALMVLILVGSLMVFQKHGHEVP